MWLHSFAARFGITPKPRLALADSLGMPILGDHIRADPMGMPILGSRRGTDAIGMPKRIPSAGRVPRGTPERCIVPKSQWQRADAERSLGAGE